jgi:adenylosuccinate lyase
VIDRYSYPEMKAIWEPDNRFKAWLEVELLVAEALAEIGEIPAAAARKMRQNARFDVDRIIELEGETPGREPPPGVKPLRHDLLAFLHSVRESLGDEGKYLHMGVTSYDIEDTALGMLLSQSADLLLSDLDRVHETVLARAREHKWTLMMGRTHAVHAEPITFGFKLAVWLGAIERARRRLEHARVEIAVGKISGAVGTYANIDPRVERYVCDKLGIAASPASTQIVQRDRHAAYLCALAVIAGSIEQFVTEIRHLARTEVLEVEEAFGEGQRGSSAMPHKRNPITAERLTGMARLMRSYAIPAIENIATWHERDLSNSSVERIILPDANVLLDYMLRKFAELVGGLQVNAGRMERNLDLLGGMVCSQTVMLELTRKGFDRDQAYKLVQGHARRAWEQGENFKQLVFSDAEITRVLSLDELEACFDYRRHLKHLETVFERFGV